MECIPVTSEKFVFTDKMYFDNLLLLSYEIQYPQFRPDKQQNPAFAAESEVLENLNLFYKTKAEDFECYAKETLFLQSVQSYLELKEMQETAIPYEAFSDYKITFLSDCFISLYYDHYLFTGGAHGTTVRFSDSWNLKTGSRAALSSFFPNNPNYREDILNAVSSYIKKQQENPESSRSTDYFDNAPNSVFTEFDEKNFYLTPKGIVIYFQQYDIAPYSSGIMQFLIPYKKGLS